MNRIPRPLRPVVVVLGGWVGLFVVVNVVILVAGLIARWSGKDPQLDDGRDRWPDIPHLRQVDDRLLVGGQTTADEYEGLADRGVTLVIDARTGSATDASEDDPEHLAELGLDYASLAVPDGRAPTPAQTRRFLDLVESADGRVFAHCGGGVGRSTSLAAVYEAARGRDLSTWEQLAVGPPTIEQIWFVSSLSPGHPEHHVPPVVAVVSRIVDAPRTVYGWLTSLI